MDIEALWNAEGGNIWRHERENKVRRFLISEPLFCEVVSLLPSLLQTQTNELLYLDAAPHHLPPPFHSFNVMMNRSLPSPPFFRTGQNLITDDDDDDRGNKNLSNPPTKLTRRDSDKRCRLIRIFLPPAKRGKRSARACAEMKFWRKEGDASSSKRHNSESCASGTRKKLLEAG